MGHVFRYITIVGALTVAALAASTPVTGAPAPPVAPAPTASFSIGGVLSGVDATSASDAWAVGADTAGKTTIVHWDGSAWQRVPSPSPGAHGSYTSLSGVAATATDDAWAVGSTTSPTGSREGTLILHWNGTVWTRVPSPSPGTRASLLDVTATSADNAWAVGYDREGPLILRWNGAAWKQVGRLTHQGTLESVAATSPRSAWAVGYLGTGGGTGVLPNNEPLIMHWNGVSWKQVPTHLAPGLANLRGVAATSPVSAWAVGCIGCSANGAGDPVIERWNGHTWKRVPGPGPDTLAGLSGVAATSATDAWAVGVPPGFGGHTTGIAHWNGRTWRMVPSPNPGGAEQVVGVTALSPTYALAVGNTEATTPFQGVISAWNGVSWN